MGKELKERAKGGMNVCFDSGNVLWCFGTG